jgi:hypothetical protein
MKMNRPVTRQDLLERMTIEMEEFVRHPQLFREPNLKGRSLRKEIYKKNKEEAPIVCVQEGELGERYE